MPDYREFFEKIPDGVMLHDAEDGSVLDANEQFGEMLGYSRDELLELSLEEFITDEPPYTRERAEEYIRAAATDGPQTFEWRDETKAGETIPVKVHLRQTTLDGHQRILAVVRDITDRKKSEQIIEELHTTARRLMETGTADEIAEITVDTLHNLVGMSKTGVHMYDEDENELVPVAWADQTEELIGEPPTFEQGEGIAWTAYETGEPQIYDDISTVPERYNLDTDVRSQITLPLDEHGVLLIESPDTNAFADSDVELARTLATHTITALNQTISEQNIREERIFIEQTLDTIADVFYVLGPDGIMRRWNDRLREVTGYTDEEISDMNAVEFFPEDEQERIGEAIEAVFTTGQATVEADFLTADGERIPYEFIANRLTDREGNPSGLVGVGRDITERKKREQQLAQQNERLEEFASVVSHDLRNPLNVAQGRLEIARKEFDSDHLSTVAQAHERMETLIEDLLALAREGETTMELKDVALADVTTRCWQNVETAEATLHIDATHTIRADHARLQQLLENLIRNAVEHGGTDVTVRAGDLPNGFFIEDDGPGIPEEARTQIFEAGYTTTDEGTGYGLQIVNRVTISHGWDITATEADGGGARFEISSITLRE